VVQGPEWNDRDTQTIGSPPENFQPGKTWFVNWCMESCVRHGHEVRWVPVMADGSVGLVELMRAIRDGNPRENLSVLQRPLDPLAFRQFNHTLNVLLAGGVPSEAPGTDPIADEMRPMDVKLINDERFVERICSTFRAALMRAGEITPLLLVLDDFARAKTMFAQAHFQILLNQVLLGLDDDETRPVRVMLVLTDKLFRDYRMGDVPQAMYKRIDLTDLPADAFPDIAWEYLERTMANLLHAPGDEKLARQMVMTKGSKIGNWRISYLKVFADIVKGAVS
jgi:hypothetical protein